MGNSCTGGGNKASATTTHSIFVKTGDKKGADTNGNIYVCMADESGKWCDEQPLNTKWKDDFERGNIDVYHVEFPQLGKISEICIRRDETSSSDSWYLEKVTIDNRASKSQSIFPVTRWINANDKLILQEFDCALPADEINPEQRAKELEHKRELYQLVENVPGAPKQVVALPDDERFSNEYQWDIVKTNVTLIAQTKFISLATPNFDSLDDFKEVYNGDSLPLPYGQKNWKSDEEFGNQRLSGCNPTMIQLCQKIPEKFAVTAEMVKPFLEGKSMEEAMNKKKMYILDLTYMAAIECTAGRKLCGPYGLFYSNDKGFLVPVAIQLMPEPAEDNPVFLPSDPEYTWLAAKMWFNMSDSSHHQSVTHLGFTHLVVETIAICTHRQLSPSHPMFKLLAPHFIYLLAINTLAVNKLVSPDGWVDDTMQIGRTGMFNIIKHNWDKWNLKEYGNIPNDFKRRGVDDTEALPNYHYRDDATLMWNAIRKYVATVVSAFYDSPEKITGDNEIQAWCKEIADAGVEGVPVPLTNTDNLSDLLTVFIFTASVGHAASNFCQYDEYAFPPNYPAMLMGEWPKNKEPLEEKDIVASLADKKQTLSVMVVTKLLSQRGTNEITNFEVQYAYDPKTMKALQQFKADLKEISATIDARNAKRTRKYTYLHPKEVPNAISI